jgi:hypothetical protein
MHLPPSNTQYRQAQQSHTKSVKRHGPWPHYLGSNRRRSRLNRREGKESIGGRRRYLGGAASGGEGSIGGGRWQGNAEATLAGLIKEAGALLLLPSSSPHSVVVVVGGGGMERGETERNRDGRNTWRRSGIAFFKKGPSLFIASVLWMEMRKSETGIYICERMKLRLSGW